MSTSRKKKGNFTDIYSEEEDSSVLSSDILECIKKDIPTISQALKSCERKYIYFGKPYFSSQVIFAFEEPESILDFFRIQVSDVSTPSIQEYFEVLSGESSSKSLISSLGLEHSPANGITSAVIGGFSLVLLIEATLSFTLESASFSALVALAGFAFMAFILLFYALWSSWFFRRQSFLYLLQAEFNRRSGNGGGQSTYGAPCE